MQATLAPSSNASLTPRDRQLLAHPPYAQATIPETYRRHIVDYTRKEQPGTILVDSNSRFLYYVLPEGKAIRYGVTVGEEAQAWSGVATIGKVAEWPDWIPTAEIRARRFGADHFGQLVGGATLRDLPEPHELRASGATLDDIGRKREAPMNSTSTPKSTERLDASAGGADERLAHAHEQITRAGEQLARLD